MGWTRERARLAALHRYRTPNDPEITDATRDLAAERLVEHVQRVWSMPRRHSPPSSATASPPC